MVFAVEDTTAQLTWLGSLLPADAGRRGARHHDTAPAASVTAQGRGVAADATITARDLATGDVLGSRPYLDGSGSIELAGLPPASTSTVSLDVDGRPAGCVRLQAGRPACRAGYARWSGR